MSKSENPAKSPTLKASIADGVAYQGLVNGVCVLLGSLAGGYAARHLPHSLSLGSWIWEPAYMLPVVFLVSGLIRLVAAGLFLRKFKEVREVEPIRHRDLIFRVSHIRPIAGATFSLFTGLFRQGRNGRIDRGKDRTPPSSNILL